MVISMQKNSKDQFNEDREKLNEIVMKYSGKNIKRFYGLDMSVYREGVLPKKTKELIGLVSSMVLRCEDCVKYHLNQCYELEVSNEELEEALAIGLIIGGSIIIPELRKTLKYWDELVKGE
jgi:AhpD family alkylhydroperoxidase